MIIKAGKKDFTKMGCLFGLGMTLCSILLDVIRRRQISIYTIVIIYCVGGVVFGAVCAFAMSLGFKFIEKKTVNLRNEISKERKIICEGPVTNKTDKRVGVGGWLFLSDAAVEFYPTNAGGKVESSAILLDDIVKTETKNNLLIIKSSSKKFTFKVYNSRLWEKMIKKEL